MKALKEYALQQLRLEFEQVVYPCIVATSGVAVFAATAATGPAIAIMVGGGLVAAATPQCAGGIKRLHELQLIYNDPPDLDFGTIVPIRPTARPAFAVPSCADVKGAERRFCRRFGKALVRHAAKDDRATAVAEALRTTVEKAVGAFEAEDDGALKRQLRAAGKRRKQLDAALRARGKAGRKLAALLRDVGTASLTETEFTDGSTAALARLGEIGLAEADARTLLDATLAPRTLDQLDVLGRP